MWAWKDRCQGNEEIEVDHGVWIDLLESEPAHTTGLASLIG